MGRDAGTRAVIESATRELHDQLSELTHELERIFLDRIPEVRGDEAIQDLMVASTFANLSVMFDALLHGIAVDDIEVPPAAVAYAQRFAQRGLPLEALLRAYRLGDHRFIQWYLAAIEPRVASSADLRRAADEIVSFTVRYIDRISEALIDIYREERRLWGQRTDAARAAQVRAVLTDDDMDAATAEIMTGHAMGRSHVGLVVWVDQEASDREQVLEAATRALRGVGDTALVVPTDVETLWGWVSSPVASEAPALRPVEEVVASHPDLHLAIGETATGLDGFRTTHREALRARAVAEASHVAGRVTRFGDVRLSALLTENVGDLRDWVWRTLGDLAAPDEDTARLRQTLRVYLETAASATETAKRLHVHRNTVRYRLRRAEEVRGRPIGDDRIDVEVALIACDQLGASVLRPDA